MQYLATVNTEKSTEKRKTKGGDYVTDIEIFTGKHYAIEIRNNIYLYIQESKKERRKITKWRKLRSIRESERHLCTCIID